MKRAPFLVRLRLAWAVFRGDGSRAPRPFNDEGEPLPVMRSWVEFGFEAPVFVTRFYNRDFTEGELEIMALPPGVTQVAIDNHALVRMLRDGLLHANFALTPKGQKMSRALIEGGIIRGK